jgi:hypothetical protein
MRVEECCSNYGIGITVKELIPLTEGGYMVVIGSEEGSLDLSAEPFKSLARELERIEGIVSVSLQLRHEP